MNRVGENLFGERADEEPRVNLDTLGIAAGQAQVTSRKKTVGSGKILRQYDHKTRLSRPESLRTLLSEAGVGQSHLRARL
jgi:hypothetical protein